MSSNKFYEIRKNLLSSSNEESVNNHISNIFNNIINYVEYSGEEVIDELLSSWESKKYKEYITYIPRKPHKYGLLYYFRANCVSFGDIDVIFCIDLESSVFIPKPSPVEAAKRLLGRSFVHRPLFSPTVIMDSAFCTNEMVSWLSCEGYNFILSGGYDDYPLISALAEEKLKRNSHIMIQDKHDLCYSFTKASHIDPDTLEELDDGVLRVAISNIFRFKGEIECECVDPKMFQIANDLNKLSDETLKYINERIGIRPSSKKKYIITRIIRKNIFIFKLFFSFSFKISGAKMEYIKVYRY